MARLSVLLKEYSGFFGIVVSIMPLKVTTLFTLVRLLVVCAPVL